MHKLAVCQLSWSNKLTSRGGLSYLFTVIRSAFDVAWRTEHSVCRLLRLPRLIIIRRDECNACQNIYSRINNNRLIVRSASNHPNDNNSNNNNNQLKNVRSFVVVGSVLMTISDNRKKNGLRTNTTMIWYGSLYRSHPYFILFAFCGTQNTKHTPYSYITQ